MTKLHITDANDGPELYIKPVPGQIVATVDPGPDQRFYAALFASAPELLKAAYEVCAFMDQGTISLRSSDGDLAGLAAGTNAITALAEQVDRVVKLQKRVFKIPVMWTTEAYVMVTARDLEEAIDLAYDIEPDDCEEADYRVGSFDIDEYGARDLAKDVR